MQQQPRKLLPSGALPSFLRHASSPRRRPAAPAKPLRVAAKRDFKKGGRKKGTDRAGGSCTPSETSSSPPRSACRSRTTGRGRPCRASTIRSPFLRLGREPSGGWEGRVGRGGWRREARRRWFGGSGRRGEGAARWTDARARARGGAPRVVGARRSSRMSRFRRR